MQNAALGMSAAGLYAAYETRNSQSIHAVTQESVPKDLALEVFQQDALLQEIASRSGHMFSRRFPVPSTVAFSWRVACNYNRDLADEFFRSVAGGEDLTATHPAYLLRERLLELKSNRNRVVRRPEVVFLCLRAFRAFVRGERLRKLQLPKDRLEFPRIRARRGQA